MASHKASEEEREYMGLVSSFGFSPDYQVFKVLSTRVTRKELFEALVAAMRDQVHAVLFAGPGELEWPEHDWSLALFVEGIQTIASAAAEFHRGYSWHGSGDYWVATGWSQLTDYQADRQIQGAFRMQTPRGAQYDTPDAGEYWIQLQVGQPTAIAREDPAQFDPIALLRI